jgi:hypothetical protein
MSKLLVRNHESVPMNIIGVYLPHDMDAVSYVHAEEAARSGVGAWNLVVALWAKHDIEEADVVFSYARQLRRMLEASLEKNGGPRKAQSG